MLAFFTPIAGGRMLVEYGAIITDAIRPFPRGRATFHIVGCEFGDGLGIRPETIKTRLHRARRLFCEYLEEKFAF